MIFRPTWIARVALHRSERGPAETAESARVRFAMVEEGVTDPLSAIRRQQYRFAEIEHLRWIGAMGGERGAKGRRIVGQRQSGGGADHALGIEGQHEHAAR